MSLALTVCVWRKATTLDEATHVTHCNAYANRAMKCGASQWDCPELQCGGPCSINAGVATQRPTWGRMQHWQPLHRVLPDTVGMSTQYHGYGSVHMHHCKLAFCVMWSSRRMLGIKGIWPRRRAHPSAGGHPDAPARRIRGPQSASTPSTHNNMFPQSLPGSLHGRVPHPCTHRN